MTAHGSRSCGREKRRVPTVECAGCSDRLTTESSTTVPTDKRCEGGVGVDGVVRDEDVVPRFVAYGAGVLTPKRSCLRLEQHHFIGHLARPLGLTKVSGVLCLNHEVGLVNFFLVVIDLEDILRRLQPF